MTRSLLAVGGGLLATLVTGAACVGPLIAITLGIGGLGWLTRYAVYREEATVATALLLAYGFFTVYRRPTACGSVATSAPATVAVPSSTSSNVVRIDTAVVLPAPFGPSSPTTVPSSTTRSRPARAVTSP